jgi:hypothetical protein
VGDELTPQYSDVKVANRTMRDSGGRCAHEAVSRRPPISRPVTAARTHVHTYAANVWDSSIVQAPLTVTPYRTLVVRFATFCSLV